jgi:hypothetical protein
VGGKKKKIADIIPETAITIEITFLDENTRRI